MMPTTLLHDPVVRRILAESVCGLGVESSVRDACRRHGFDAVRLITLGVPTLRILIAHAHDRTIRRSHRAVAERARSGAPLRGVRRAWECGGHLFPTPQAASGYARRVKNASLAATYAGGCSGSYTYPVSRTLVAVR